MYDTSKQPEKMRLRYEELPEEVKELFEYETVQQSLIDIGKEFGLREEDIPLLQMEVELILYGFLTREGLAERLQESLGIESARAEQMVKRLNEDLFLLANSFLSSVEDALAESEDILPPTIVTTSNVPEPELPPNTPQAPPSEEVNKMDVKPLRTFAMDVDMSRVHGYGAFHSGETPENSDNTPVHSSSQDDVLKK